MPDTGAAAGQQKEYAVLLKQNGAALSYANAAAFEAAGWALVYRAAQTTQTPTYTLQPHTNATLAAEGWHLIVLTLVNGAGPALLKLPGTGTGWTREPAGFQAECESVDLDAIYSALLQSVGVAVSGDTVRTQDYSVTEGDSFLRELTVLETALTRFDFTAENLDDGTLTLSGHVRRSDNRVGPPDGKLSVSPKTATTGSNPVLYLAWADYPSAIASVQAGMDLSFPITAASTSPKTFTVAGDQRDRFSVGGAFLVQGSTANDGTYTVTALALSSGSTVITVSETVPSSTADGEIDPTADEDISPVPFRYDVQVTGSKTFAVTAVSTGSKQFTIAGDRRRWFAPGGKFTVTGSTGNNGTYTVASVTKSGSNTLVVVTETVPNSTADGNLVAAFVITLGRGTITVNRQEVRP